MGWDFKAVEWQMRRTGTFPYIDQDHEALFAEFEAIPVGIRDGILVTQMLHQKSLENVDWLNPLKRISEENREAVLDFLVDTRLEMSKQESKAPVWIIEACRAATKYGFAIPPRWIEILRLSITMVEQNLTNYRKEIAQWGRDWLEQNGL
jgi:hypothetical protein